MRNWCLVVLLATVVAVVPSCKFLGQGQFGASGEYSASGGSSGGYSPGGSSSGGAASGGATGSGTYSGSGGGSAAATGSRLVIEVKDPAGGWTAPGGAFRVHTGSTLPMRVKMVNAQGEAADPGSVSFTFDNNFCRVAHQEGNLFLLHSGGYPRRNLELRAYLSAQPGVYTTIVFHLVAGHGGGGGHSEEGGEGGGHSHGRAQPSDAPAFSGWKTVGEYTHQGIYEKTDVRFPVQFAHSTVNKVRLLIHGSCKLYSVAAYFTDGSSSTLHYRRKSYNRGERIEWWLSRGRRNLRYVLMNVRPQPSVRFELQATY